MSKPKTETFYCWKYFDTPEGEEQPRLLTPWADPHQYEYAFDFLYENAPSAYQGLREHDAEEEAKADGWVLCRATLEPIRQEGSNEEFYTT